MRELGVTDRVSFTGFVSQDQLREICYRSHIFLHPSQTGLDGNQEGIPNSMLEAMATGLPVFATEHGGIPEAIENGVNGVLVPERDDEALARALLNAAQDPGFLSRIGHAGAERCEKILISTQARRLEGIYLNPIRGGGEFLANPDQCSAPGTSRSLAASIAIDLLAMPRLRDVLNPWLADVIHQHEGQTVCVWPTELIDARASAIFGDRRP